mmetsp:Transcript_16727/g.29255  ORF Transcript_16727/g.29255 Transcript_16727/m.29255 type:complete len:231 (+) Transcript_16727:266-958(+)
MGHAYDDPQSQGWCGGALRATPFQASEILRLQDVLILPRLRSTCQILLNADVDAVDEPGQKQVPLSHWRRADRAVERKGTCLQVLQCLEVSPKQKWCSSDRVKTQTSGKPPRATAHDVTCCTDFLTKTSTNKQFSGACDLTDSAHQTWLRLHDLWILQECAQEGALTTQLLCCYAAKAIPVMNLTEAWQAFYCRRSGIDELRDSTIESGKDIIEMLHDFRHICSLTPGIA